MSMYTKPDVVSTSPVTFHIAIQMLPLTANMDQLMAAERRPLPKTNADDPDLRAYEVPAEWRANESQLAIMIDKKRAVAFEDVMIGADVPRVGYIRVSISKYDEDVAAECRRRFLVYEAYDKYDASGVYTNSLSAGAGRNYLRLFPKYEYASFFVYFAGVDASKYAEGADTSGLITMSYMRINIVKPEFLCFTQYDNVASPEVILEPIRRARERK